MLNSFQSYFNEATDEEIVQFFSVFTTEERSNEFSDMFGLVNYILRVKDGDDWVRKYFVYRNLIVKEADTSTLGPILDKLIADNEKAWKEYIGGKDQAVGRFVGQLAKASGVTPQDAKAFIESRKNS